MTAKSCHLYDLVATEPDMGEPEPASDQKTVAKELFDLLRRCIGADVEVLGSPVQQQIPDAAANQAGLIAMVV